MASEGYRHSLYCWTLPATWGSRQYGRFSLPPSARDPLRCRRPCVVRASISADSARDNEEAYRQFANMLGEDLHANPQTVDVSAPQTVDAQSAPQTVDAQTAPRAVDARSAAYADFADMLGLDGNDRKEDGNKSVANLSTKKVEIDPEDYSIFDEMLEQTGGRGTKPVKGAKPYSRYVATIPRERAKRRSGMVDALEANVNDAVKPEDDVSSPTAPGFYLTEEEKAQAYAVMMEEFGPGAHDGVETWTPDEDVDELELQSKQLLKPPERPGVPPQTEPTTQGIDYASSSNFDLQQDAEEDVGIFTLQPKPSMPVPISTSSTQDSTETILAESGAEGTNTSSSEISLTGSSAQLKAEEHLTHGDEQETRNFDTVKDDITPELIPPPNRPVSAPVPVLSEKSQVPVEEVQRKTLDLPVLSRDVQTSEQVTLSVKPKPQRGLESLTPPPGEYSSPELNLRSDRRKQFSRKQKLRSDGPPIVLKNPKLVHESE